MGKIDIIEYCGDCSNRVYQGNDLWCDKLDQKVGENMHPPKECPLPDVAQPAGEAALCACKKPLISEKSYCTVCGRDIYAVAHPPAPITCPKCGESEPVMQCEKCGHNFNWED